MFDLSVFSVGVSEEMRDVGFSIVLLRDGGDVDSSFLVHAQFLAEHADSATPTSGYILATIMTTPSRFFPHDNFILNHLFWLHAAI